jgi:hypothetical protein
MPNAQHYPDLPESLKVENRPTATTTPNLGGSGRDQSPSKWRDQIKVHPAADFFPMMSDEDLDALAADIKKSGKLTSPIVFWVDEEEERWLLDGRNRIEAAERAGYKIKDHDLRFWLHRHQIDPYDFVISANIHRRDLTGEQRRDLIAQLLKANPGKSDRAIAKPLKASPTTVGTVRKEMETTGQLSKLDSSIRKGADGKERKQPAKKVKKTAADPAAPDAAKAPSKRAQKHQERNATAEANRLADVLFKRDRNLARELIAYLSRPQPRDLGERLLWALQFVEPADDAAEGAA